MNIRRPQETGKRPQETGGDPHETTGDWRRLEGVVGGQKRRRWVRTGVSDQERQTANICATHVDI